MRVRRRAKTNDVDIADFVKPEGVDVIGSFHEVAVREVLVDFGGGRVELLEDPLLDEALISGGLSRVRESASVRVKELHQVYLLRLQGNVVGVELGDRELGGVPELVAELRASGTVSEASRSMTAAQPTLR